MKKLILMLAFAVFGTALFASNTEPLQKTSTKPIDCSFERQSWTIKSGPEEFVYCGVCNGVIYCGRGATKELAIDDFLAKCEALGCC